MKGFVLSLSGKYGHFKRPETSNSPCTFSFMHKPAFIGALGAVNGIERTQMAEIAPQLYDDLLYGIRVVTPVIKESVAFTKRKVPSIDFYQPGRRFQEVLRNPSYQITVGLANKRSESLFEEFKSLVKASKSRYPVYFGVVNCPCNFRGIQDVTISEKKKGIVEMSCVFSSSHKLVKPFDETKELIFERIPTHEIDRLYTESKIIGTVCPNPSYNGEVLVENKMKVDGDYYLVDERTPIWMM